MAIREGAWDCKSCGRTRNPGPATHCGGCGVPRGDDVEFYLPEDAREVDAAEELKKAAAGPDWKCPYCNGDNPGYNTFCASCGGPQDGTAKRATKTTLTKLPEPVAAAGPSWLRRIALGCGALILLFFVSCYVLTSTHVSTMKVTSMSWQRAIDVETLGMVTDEGWQDRGEVPANAKILSKQRKVRETLQVQTGSQTRTRMVTQTEQTGTNKVKVGTKDLGNGYFEDVYEDEPVYSSRQVEESYEEPVYRADPVYDTMVRYQVERWQKSSTAEEKGEDNKPVWPTVREAAKTRAGGRHENYSVSLQGDGKSFSYSPASESEFSALSVGQTVEADVSRLGVVSAVRAK